MPDDVLRRAIHHFASIVGADNVLTSDEQLEEYRDPYAMTDTGMRLPAAVVSPQSVEEIRAILRAANEHGIPLWTVSQGRNYGYGGAAPRVRGSVILELRRMNRVLEVDEVGGWALVEPGVRFVDLYAHLRERGCRLWMSSPAVGLGSVVGNALERGLGLTPYGEHGDMHCGMEVVLANGDVLRTGMGAMTNGRAWQLYRPGFGPAIDGLFMQSNFGVVTKMGIWLMPTPETFCVCRVTVPDDASLGPLVDAVRPLKLGNVINGQNVMVAGPLRVAMEVSSRDRWFSGRGPIPEAVVAEVMRTLEIGAWNTSFGLYGPEELVEARYRIVRDALGRVPGAQVARATYPGDAAPTDIAPRDRLYAGIPSPESMTAVRWLGAEGAHVTFAPICPVSGEDAIRSRALAQARAAEYGFDYAGIFRIATRHMIHVFMVTFDRSNPDDRSHALALVEALVKDAGAAGYGEYRTHLDLMDLVASQYEFNDHAGMRLNELLKDALDPNGILSPGKQGIWPGAMRPPG